MPVFKSAFYISFDKADFSVYNKKRTNVCNVITETERLQFWLTVMIDYIYKGESGICQIGNKHWIWL